MTSTEVLSLFSNTYAESRQKFLAAAAARSLEVDSYELDLKGLEGEALATDVVFEGPREASKVLLIISGVHGAEGFPGSAVQAGVIKKHYVLPSDTAILHVHAINPHGFSFTRRVTQENVDLNRNFIDFTQDPPVNEGYRVIKEGILPEEWPPQDTGLLDHYRAEHGEKALQYALTLGQYEFSDGIWFGGFAPTWSNNTFRQILRKYAADASVVVSVDIHTGLGPYGHGEQIFASYDNSAIPIAEQWWGQITNVNTGSSTSVPMKGPIQAGLTEECIKAKHVGMCLEYGTYPFERISTAVRADHWAFKFNTYETPKGKSIRREMKDAFYPNADDWKALVWDQAERVVTKALDGLKNW